MKETLKKIFTCVIAASILMTSITIVIPTYAMETWDGTASSTFDSGTGSADSPFVITTASQLYFAVCKSYYDSTYSSAYYLLENDIQLNPTEAFVYSTSGVVVGINKALTPVRWDSYRFAGHFDGQGHTITGVYCSPSYADESCSFFGTLRENSTVKNITLGVGYIQGGYMACGISNYIVEGTSIENCNNYATLDASANCAGIGGYNYGTISKCNNYGLLVSSSEYEGSNYAGIVYENENLTISCNNYSDIVCAGNSGGIAYSSIGTLSQCVNYGNITTTQFGAGGIVNTGFPISCINYGDISVQGTYSYAAGIAVGGAANNCVNYGKIAASNSARTCSMVGDLDYSSQITGDYSSTISGCVDFGENNIPICSNNTSGTIFNCWVVGEKNNLFDGVDVITYDYANSEVFLHELNTYVSNHTTGYISYWKYENGKLSFATDNMFSIFATATDGGTISPSGETRILFGHSCTYQMVPDYGYTLSDIQIDGRSVEVNSSYTFNDITEDHTITAIFTPDGTFSDSYEGGSGTVDDPFLIRTPQQLALLAHEVGLGEKYLGSYFELVSDIVLNPEDSFVFDSSGKVSGINTKNPPQEWKPIGTGYSNSFCGHFNGAAHTISGLYIVGSDKNGYSENCGLFGNVSSYTSSPSVIENINLGYGFIQSNWNVGGIAGSCYSIKGCINQNTAILGKDGYIGGIVGWCNERVTNCSNYANITGQTYVGGIAGKCDTAFGCENYGNVLFTNYSGAGIAGCVNLGIFESTNYGKIQGGQYVGGIAGETSYCENIYGCFNYGDVSGAYAGALIGEIQGGRDLNFTNCCNLGNVPGGSADYGCNKENATLYFKNVYCASEATVSTTNRATIIDNNILGSISIASDFNLCKPAGIEGLRYWKADPENGRPIWVDADDVSVHSISITTAGGGTIEPRNHLLLPQGSFITLTFVPEDGNTVGQVIVNGQITTPSSQVSIDCLSTDYSIQVSFQDKFGNRITGFTKGSGTANDPFLITNPDEFGIISSNVNKGNTNYKGVFFALDCDILFNPSDAFNYSNGIISSAKPSANIWQPIGTLQNQFEGTIDGRNHLISGLNITSTTDSLGLFGVIGTMSKISNLNITDSLISGGGNNYGFVAGVNNGCIEGCSVSTSSLYGCINNAGGIVGYNTGITEQCINAACVSGKQNIGGIVGNNSGTILDCENQVDLSGGQKLGGIVGTNSGKVSSCINRARIATTSYCAGGIAGESWIDNTSASYTEIPIITDCNNYGSVTSAYYAGGVVGSANYSLIANCNNYREISCTNYCVGGIAGNVYGKMDGSVAVTDCKNHGDVTGSSTEKSVNANVGGIVGNTSEIIASCANYGNIRALGTNSDGAGCGGIAGSAEGNIYNCANYGSVFSVGENVGGVVGIASLDVANCYNRGNVTGSTHAGGIAGKHIGRANFGHQIFGIYNCYNIGTIVADNKYGMIVGYNMLCALVSSCYYIGDSVPGIGYDEAEGETASLTVEDFFPLLNSNANNYYEFDLQSWILDDANLPIHNLKLTLQSNATIYLFSLDGEKVCSDLSVKNGICRVHNLPDGEYRVSISMDGYVPYIDSVTVADGIVRIPTDLSLVIAGNINGVGTVSVDDMQCLYTFLTANRREGSLKDNSTYFCAVADVNSDGHVDVYDLQLLYEYLCGIASLKHLANS